MEPFPDSWSARSNRMEEPTNSSQGHVLPLGLKQSGASEKRKGTVSEGGKEENSEALIDRRLTIHCIVEEISSLDEALWKKCPHNSGTSVKAGRENSKWWHCECRNIVMNSCVVIKAGTSMNDLVKTVLAKLGYPNNASSSAMGSILIRNWKALSLNTICPNPKMTVGDVLGELSSLVTLQIQILRPKSAFVQEIKDKLLSFLIAKTHGFLNSTGFPLDLLMLTKFCEESAFLRKHLKEESSEEMQRRFEAWLGHIQKNETFDREINPFTASIPINNENNNNNNNNNNVIINNANGNSKMENKSDANSKVNGSPINITSLNNNSGRSSSSAVSNESPSRNNTDNEYVKYNTEIERSNSCNFEINERSLHSAQTKTRMRTSFDPDLELPKLLKWYLENPHPTRQQIHEYVVELNSLESRRGRKKLDMNNVVYWFKNARAAQKRSEYRKFCNLSVPGTKKNSNLLKIPLGKTSSSVTSEEHITLSDEEPCGTPENSHSYNDEKGKCMQVMGNWNANGAGEAVLEMRITPPKQSRPSSPEKIEPGEEREPEPEPGQEESSAEEILSIVEESGDNGEAGNSGDENKSGDMNGVKNIPKNFDKIISGGEEEEPQRRQQRKNIEETGEGAGGVSNIKPVEDEYYSQKIKSKNELIHRACKKLNGLDHSDAPILSRYKTASHNSIIRHSFLYMSQCMNAKLNNLTLSSDERRKRNRTFIDPLTEVPRLEQWFQLSTHPSHSLIVRYTEELNGMPYRRKFPKLETKNVQFWFKNRRAKNKRLNYMDTNNFLR